MTLGKLREDSGLPIAEIIRRATEVDASFPQSHAGLLCIERRGTRDYKKLNALSVVYGMKVDDLAPIASPENSPEKSSKKLQIA